MLLVNLSFEIMVNASTINNVEKGDTLSKRMINGLEVVPIKMKTLIYKGQSEVNLWRLHIPDFEESFQNFESKYPGRMGDSFSIEILEKLADWKEYVWTEVVPAEIKTLVGKCSSPHQREFLIWLYVNNEGNAFAVEFIVSDVVLEALNSLPKNMMKELYDNLLKEKCEVIKQVEFCLNKDKVTNQEGKEYIIERWDWFLYNKFGTCHPTKLKKMVEDGSMEKIFDVGGKK